MDSSPAASDPLKLLIVDDDEDAHFFLRRDLKKCRIAWESESVMNGDDAVNHLEACLSGTKKFPDVIFLDVKMPGKTGFDVLEWISSQGLLKRLRLAMCSSSSDPKDVSRAKVLGAHTYLVKPSTVTALTEVLRSAAALRAEATL